MLFLLFFLEITFFFFSNVAGLNITLQTDTIVGQPSLVLWTRQPSDGNGLLVFDLRFIKPDNEDIGLAVANVEAPPTTEFGTLLVVFQSPGSYLLVAVTGPGYTKIGQSSQVNAFQVPTTSSIPTSTSQSVPSATSSAKPTSTSASSSATSTSTSATSSATSTSSSSGTQRKKNLGAIIGGTLGGVAFLGLLAALGIVFLRRRKPTEDTNRRWTFNRDKYILPPVLDIRRTTPMNAEFFSPDDIEQQQGFPHVDFNPTSPILMMAASPLSGSRPSSSLKSPNRPLPLIPPVPLTLKSHEEDMVVQMEQIRNKMTELEKNPGPTQHIILDDLQKQMNWLKSQIEKRSLS